MAGPFLLALPLLALALGLQVGQALASARRSSRIEGSLPRRAVVAALTTVLVLVQPAARLDGRLAHGLSPWRRARLGAFRFPWARTETRWYEQWQSFSDRMTALEGVLHTCGARVRRGGECDRWELQAFAGAAGGVRVRAVIEEHGRGRQLMRTRVRPHLAGFVRAGLIGLPALAAAAAVAHAWETTAIAVVLLVALAVYAVAESGLATAAALTALTALDAAEVVEPPLVAIATEELGVDSDATHPVLEARENVA